MSGQVHEVGSVVDVIMMPKPRAIGGYKELIGFAIVVKSRSDSVVTAGLRSLIIDQRTGKTVSPTEAGEKPSDG